jgi:hypothetical protein
MNKDLFSSEESQDLSKFVEDYNWREAFNFSTHGGITDVMRIVAMDDGENDGPNWIGVFEMKNGTFVFLSAGCDYTGWDCRAGGRSEVYKTEKAAIQGLGDDERYRLKLKMVY